MEFIVANVDNVKFDIEVALEQQLGAQPLPFPGMDKSTSAICVFYVDGSCQKGANCPFRHVRGDRTIVCKHWLRGLCKKGDQCEFLHEYDMTKMPECYFYTRFNACHNKECPFLHIDPESKIRPCPWYERGFCRHGPNCRHRHIRKVLCLNYLAGFCPDGPECKFMHPAFELPQIDEIAMKARKAGIICHVCNEAGHKSYQCPKNPEAGQFVPAGGLAALAASHSAASADSENTDPNAANNKDGGVKIDSGGRPGVYLGDHGGGAGQIRGHYPYGQPHGHGHGGHGPGHGQIGLPTYQPYQFHPRPLFHKGTGGGGRDGKDGRNAGGDKDSDQQQQGNQQPRRALEDVVCYKCGYKGHYANKCTKGHLAFLSHKAGANLRDGGRGGGPGGVGGETGGANKS